MTLETLRDYCLSKKGTSEDLPFDEDTLCLRVGGKIFALTSFSSAPTTVNLKNDPEKNVQLRDEYDCVTPGFHMNKKHWNTVILDGTAPDNAVREWIDDSYQLVFNSLSMKLRDEIQLLIE